MPEYQRKVQRITASGGMNWNRPVDAIPDGQISYARNIRLDQQGRPTTRPGLTFFTTPTGTPTYIHSNSRLNNYSGNLPFFSNVYTMGADTGVWIGKTNADFTNATINPVKLPPSGSTNTMSGNPLTMVDSATTGGVSGWKYIGDSSQMLAAGYYPGDTPGTTMARALTMGMKPPVFNPSITINGGGLLNGSYQWVCVFRRKFTQASSNPSAATRNTQSTPATPLSSQSVTFTLPTTPIDPQTGSADSNIIVDVYRFGGTVFRWAYVGTDTSGASFTDNLPDSAILAAQSPSQTTDPTTGLTRFNLFQPFPVPDIARYSTSNATASKTTDASGSSTIWILTAAGGDTFNVGIVQGSAISINNALFTVYQVRSSTVVEITEDATGTLTNGSTYPWSIPAGTLVMGQACPHIWGPFGTGQTGAVIFGCGAANAVDTLFWTNGNDPDATDIANSLVVTSPSEPLKGGCVYNGIAYCWSTERQFQIFPSLSVPGQFYVQEIVGGRGLWWEWSLTVQSNSIADQSVSWVGKDGIYNFSPSTGTVSLTDATMYPFFPHDNLQPDTLLTIFPWINIAFMGEGSLVLAPDQTLSNAKYHRLQWENGVLFYDFPANAGATKFNTLVFDSKQAKGWICVDLYKNTNTKPIARMTEVGGNNMKVALGGTVYDYGTMVGSNNTDDGTNITGILSTSQDDNGDPRGRKLYFDTMFDVDPGGNNSLNAAPILDYFTQAGPNIATFPTSAGRVQTISDVFTNGLGLLGKTYGVTFSWTQATTTPVYLYQYEYSWAPKPEVSINRATDKTDDGYNGAKYVRGFSIECNTFGNTPRLCNVLTDGVKATNPLTGTTIFTIDTGANSQIELPFAITPTIGTELQVSIDATDSSTDGWEVFQVRWVWEKWPDLARESSAILNLGTDSVKYIRGFTIPVDTGGIAAQFKYTTDLNQVAAALLNVTAPLAYKTPVPIAFDPPILAHTIQLIPQSALRAWYEEIVWDFEVWPELIQEYSAYIMPAGKPKPFYLRGFSIPVDTNGVAVDFKIRLDNDNVIDLGSVTTPAGEKTPVVFVMPVSLAGSNAPHAVRIEPQSAVRCWYGEIVWDGEEWPERAQEFGLWTFPDGHAKPAYVRGFSMAIETNGMSVSFIARLEGNVTVNLGSFFTQPGIKTVVPFVFLPPVVQHTIRIEPQGTARCWYQETVWDCEEYPELSLEETPILDCGYRRAKFMQGVVIPMDTNGLPVQFQFINIDTGLVAFTSAPVTTNGKQTITFSWPPFIAHLIQIIPMQAARIFYAEASWVWEPTPEQALTWTTPFMTHGLSGWLHQRLCWFTYLCTSAATLTRNFTDGTTESYNLPSTGGLYSKFLVTLTPKKSLAFQYSATAPGLGVKVYVNDTEFHTRAWGQEGPYSVQRPIGSPSVVQGAEV